MNITVANKEQSLWLAKMLLSKGLKPEQVVSWLKSKGYTIKGVKFVAYRIMGIMEGLTVPKYNPKSKQKVTSKPQQKQKVEVNDNSDIPF